MRLRKGSRGRRSLGLFGGFTVGLWDRNILSRLPNYIFQCSLATVSLIVILLVEDAVFRAAIVVAVASTAFTVFVVPNSIAASPRRVIGGHAVAVIVGTALAFALQIPTLESASEEFRIIRDVVAALSVGISIFIMVVTNTEHPPAAGTALGLLIPGWTLSAVTFILLSALILSIIRLVLRPKLINLL